MPANIINKSGTTSTFIPGGTGGSGKRASVTFYGTKDESVIDNPITFMLNDSSVTISNIYGDDIIPDIGDRIIYSEPNKTYSLYISNKESDYYDVTISEEWNTQQHTELEETDISDISLSVTCVNSHRQEYSGFRYNIVKDISNLNAIVTETIPQEARLQKKEELNVSSVCGFTFNIASTNGLPLGKYKLQMEFVTDWSSPGMDTRIAKKFQQPNIYSNKQDYNANTGEKCTLRGYVTNYSCKGSTETYNNDNRICPYCGLEYAEIIWTGKWWKKYCFNCGKYDPIPENPDIISDNFDDEKLDNFEVTIKDYTEGEGEISYTTTKYIPIDVIKNAYNANHPYKCILYLYVDGTKTNQKEKIYMKDLSDTINTSVVRDTDTRVVNYRSAEDDDPSASFSFNETKYNNDTVLYPGAKFGYNIKLEIGDISLGHAKYTFRINSKYLESLLQDTHYMFYIRGNSENENQTFKLTLNFTINNYQNTSTNVLNRWYIYACQIYKTDNDEVLKELLKDSDNDTWNYLSSFSGTQDHPKINHLFNSWQNEGKSSLTIRGVKKGLVEFRILQKFRGTSVPAYFNLTSITLERETPE